LKQLISSYLPYIFVFIFELPHAFSISHTSNSSGLLNLIVAYFLNFATLAFVDAIDLLLKEIAHALFAMALPFSFPEC
jgi:hypothetical protein